MKKHGLALVALTLASGGQAANLIANGDFEAGNTGFTSDYTFTSNGSPAAVYTVGTNPKAFNGAFVQMGDHSSGTGKMMIVNGSGDTNDVVWRSGLIAVDSFEDYFFEAFVASVYNQNPPVLSFMISLDGGTATTLATLPNTLTTGTWQGMSTSFNTGSAASVQLFLRNAQTAFGGNDFAVDDVSLSTTSIVNPPSPVPEPASWALILGGFGLAGGFIRSRMTGRSILV